MNKDQLEKMTKQQLLQLGAYYGVSMSHHWDKEKLIKAILKLQINLPKYTPYLDDSIATPAIATKSVRIQRIEDRMKGK